MPIGKLFGINPVVSTANQYQVTKTDSNFVKNTFNFENANPNRPETRNDVKGKNLYCLA